jgi:hypothetical protein
VNEYIKLLKPRSTVLVSLRSIEPELKRQLEELGVAVFENVMDEAVLNSFKNYITKTLSTR